MKNKQRTFSGIFLTAGFVLLALLFGYGSFSLGSKEFMRELGAAIGASAGVLPNEYNTLAQSLLKKEAEINQKEIALAEREAAVLRRGGEDSGLAFITLFVGLMLLFLIMLNFYLDRKRNKERNYD